MASFLEGGVAAIGDAFAASAALIALIGTASKIRRASQHGALPTPCVIIEAVDDGKTQAQTADARDMRFAVHCYHAYDLKCSEIAEAAIAAVDNKTTLTASGFKELYAHVPARITQPIWSELEDAYRADFWIDLSIRRS